MKRIFGTVVSGAVFIALAPLVWTLVIMIRLT